MLSDLKLKVAESNVAMEEKVGQLEAKVDRLVTVAESNVDMEEKVGQLETKMAGLDAKMNAKMDGLDTKMDQVLHQLRVLLVVNHSDV